MVLSAESFHAIHVVDNLRASSGGPSRSVTAVADALAQEGAQVTLLSAETDSDAPLVLPRQPDVALKTLNADPRAGLWRAAEAPFGRAVGRAIQSDQATVVHTHGLWVPSNRAAALAARRAGVPLVVSPKGMLSPRAFSVKRAKKELGWRLYQRRTLHVAAAFQATSEAEADDIRRFGFRQPVAVIPHGVALPTSATCADASGDRTALFLSRFHPIKGLPDLIEAWDRVRPSGWRLLLVGPDEGGHRAEVERLVAERGLAHSVAFRQPVGESEKPDVFAAADLFVLPSHSENFGLVVAEALAFGLPVLTTRGTPWQALPQEGCGWWTDTGADALADALLEATTTPLSELRAMGLRGRAYVERDLSWAHSGRRHLALYCWLLGCGPRPDFVV